MRAWYIKNMSLGLLYQCSLGDLRLDSPVALLQNRRQDGVDFMEVVPMEHQLPAQRDQVASSSSLSMLCLLCLLCLLGRSGLACPARHALPAMLCLSCFACHALPAMVERQLRGGQRQGAKAGAKGGGIVWYLLG